MDQRQIPAIAYRLWNPKVAAGLGFLFTPAFSAWLHAINWREIGEQDRARANMVWVYGIFMYMVLILCTVLIPLPKALDSAIGRVLTPLLWLAWYWFEGRKQSRYVESIGGNYIKKSWWRPLLALVLGLALYLALAIAVVYAYAYATQMRIPATRDPVELAAWVKPRILNKWHEKPVLSDATIEKIDLARKDEITYTGTVDATIEGKPQRLKLELIVEGDNAGWHFVKETQAAPQGK